MGLQRFLSTDYIGASATVLSATAVQSGFPVTWVKEQSLSRGWRSPVGWTVMAGFNDKLDFTEAGAARVATLAAGYYATGAAMATAVQTAMNAAPSVTNTYAVTYDTGTKTFTIARTAGAAALVLKFAVGAVNYGASASPDLGYSDTDKSGDTTYTGESTVYQSRHAIFANVGLGISDPLAFAFTAVAYDPAMGGTLTVQNNTATFVGVGARTVPAGNYAPSGGQGRAAAFFTAGFSQFWRLSIDQRVNSAGYSEVLVWRAGSEVIPSVCTSVEFRKRFEELSTLEYAKGGAHYQDQQARRAVWNLSWLEVPEADRVKFEAIAAACPLGKSFFLVLDSDAPVPVYGFLRAGLEEQYVPHPYWNVPIEFAQAL